LYSKKGRKSLLKYNEVDRPKRYTCKKYAKETKAALLLLDKVDFRKRKITRQKDGYQKAGTVVCTAAPSSLVTGLSEPG
jgi:hypothetical protein